MAGLCFGITCWLATIQAGGHFQQVMPQYIPAKCWSSCGEALRSKVIIIVAVVACLAAFVASQEEVACQEETCLASSAGTLVVVHHTAQEEVACLQHKQQDIAFYAS